MSGCHVMTLLIYAVAAVNVAAVNVAALMMNLFLLLKHFHQLRLDLQSAIAIPNVCMGEYHDIETRAILVLQMDSR